jgi:RimJ/RimL family protein N-acetyltransferase
MQLNFPDPPLSGDGIVLRALTDDDIGWIVQTCSNPELNRYIPDIPYPYSVADALGFAASASQGWEDGSTAIFVIARSSDGAGRGMLELHVSADDQAVAAVGYWLRREARGQGAATIAVRLVSRWAFARLGIERLELTTAPDNAPSQRVAGRAGFTREGLRRAALRTPHGRRDSVMFSLLPGDLSQAPSSAG